MAAVFLLGTGNALSQNQDQNMSDEERDRRREEITGRLGKRRIYRASKQAPDGICVGESNGNVFGAAAAVTRG